MTETLVSAVSMTRESVQFFGLVDISLSPFIILSYHQYSFVEEDWRLLRNIFLCCELAWIKQYHFT